MSARAWLLVISMAMLLAGFSGCLAARFCWGCHLAASLTLDELEQLLGRPGHAIQPVTGPNQVAVEGAEVPHRSGLPVFGALARSRRPQGRAL